jgi:hypothetical protein
MMRRDPTSVSTPMNAKYYAESASAPLITLVGSDGDKQGMSTVKTAWFGLLCWGSGMAPTLAMTLSPHKQPSAVLLLPLK